MMTVQGFRAYSIAFVLKLEPQLGADSVKHLSTRDWPLPFGRLVAVGTEPRLALFAQPQLISRITLAKALICQELCQGISKGSGKLLSFIGHEGVNYI